MRVATLDRWPRNLQLPKGYEESFIKKIFGVRTGDRKNPTNLGIIFIDKLDRVHLFRKNRRVRIRTNGTPGLRVEKACFDLTLELIKEGWKVKR